MFRCICGKTEVSDNKHPYDCETCPTCGSKILAEGEEYDAPAEHVIQERIDEFGRVFHQCKRCREIL